MLSVENTFRGEEIPEDSNVSLVQTAEDTEDIHTVNDPQKCLSGSDRS